jgi:hypothetical protein
MEKSIRSQVEVLANKRLERGEKQTSKIPV